MTIIEDNPRVVALQNAITRRQALMQQALHDLRNRDKDPAFALAKGHFDDGLRVYQHQDWDGEKILYIYLTGKEKPIARFLLPIYWDARPAEHDLTRAIDALRVRYTPKVLEQVMYHLENLSLESGEKKAELILSCDAAG